MNRLHNVIAATDFSLASRAALLQAARLADENDASLHVLHVVPRHEMADVAAFMPDAYGMVKTYLHDDARDRLVADVAELGLTQRAEIHITMGSVIHEILAAVQRFDVDLLAIGVNGASRRRGIGTVAVRCARKAPTKVLLVPEQTPEKFGKIIACIDFSSLTHPVLEQALRVARIDGASVTAVHVYQAPWQRARWGGRLGDASEVERQLQGVLTSRLKETIETQSDEGDDVEIRTEVISNHDHGEGIIAFAQEHDADLLVLGTTGRSALAYMLLGTTAEKVLRGVGCAALTIKLPGVPPSLATALEAESA